ncbi:MAG: Gfo/Idh/MocA family oxidoreductase [Phycisphaerae bacterium]|nr:Gfo/Idh/MocA family oxidoreductase [Phycisphaerae bacterium]
MKRYVIVGTGGRSEMYFKALTDTHADVGQLVGLCDLSQTRMNYYASKLTAAGKPAVPTFPADRFDEMIRTTKPDKVIVTTRDCFHDFYIIRAMQLGCDAITEKPMTTDEVKCQGILDAIAKTGRKLTVTFNYRYSPKRAKVKELLQAGTIGQIKSVDFEWLLDIRHGADYFRRWHRDKANSGGLMVHKATHHFDLVNWWIASSPQRVYATGSLGFYGDKAGQGPASHSDRCHTCKADCKFRLDLAANASLKALYLDAEPDNGYIRDQCVFGAGITIEDTMSLSVRYDSGAMMSYSLNAFMPYEGYRIAFNGTTGRIELIDVESTYISGTGEPQGETLKKGSRILVCPHRQTAYDLDVPLGVGGHGGGDTKLLDDLFRDPVADPLGRAANHIDGARSILTGIAANRSIARGGEPVDVASLVRLPTA